MTEQATTAADQDTVQAEGIRPDQAAGLSVMTVSTQHRATWWVYPEPGNSDPATRIRHQKTMRGTWGYDATCSCGGFDSRTGGGTRRSVQELLDKHRSDVRFDEEIEMAEDKKLGEMTAEERLAAVRRAVAKFQAELNQAAPGIARVLEGSSEEDAAQR